jgi:hypothetical protein
MLLRPRKVIKMSTTDDRLNAIQASNVDIADSLQVLSQAMADLPNKLVNALTPALQTIVASITPASVATPPMSSTVTSTIQPTTMVSPPMPKLTAISLEPFSGVSDVLGPTGFFREVETMKEMRGIDDDTFLKSWMPGYLKQEAAVWFLKSKSLFTSWTEFRRLFFKRFDPTVVDFDVLAALRTVRMKNNEKFQVFFERCRKILLRASDNVSIEYQINAMKEGLARDLYWHIGATRFSDLESFRNACNAAERLNDLRGEPPFPVPSVVPNKNGNGKKSKSFCKIHKMCGHSTENCRQNPDKQLKPTNLSDEPVNKVALVCARCGMKNHSAATCRVNLERLNARRSGQTAQVSKVLDPSATVFNASSLNSRGSD